MNKYDIPCSEIDIIRTMNPELAAHNIALAYVQATSHPIQKSDDEDVESSDVFSLANQYVQSYNYAYNYVVHENELIKNAE